MRDTGVDDGEGSGFRDAFAEDGEVYKIKVRFWFCKKSRWVASEKDAEASPEGAQRRERSDEFAGRPLADGTEAAAMVQKLKG